MARKSLTGMLSVVDEDRAGTDAQPPPLQAPPESDVTPTTPTAMKPKKVSQPKQPSGRDAAQPVGAEPLDDQAKAALPRYLELTRKEARLTDDQLANLAILTRKLNKTRQGTGVRITDNTLIRVAVDLLLQSAGDLAGHDEASLRRSVGL